MNDQQHTPGPWNVEADQENAHLHPCYQYRFITAGNEDGGTWEIVARMPDAPNQEANARLIAAAPELLAALKGISAALNQPATYPTDIEYCRTHARSAIRKALGVEQESNAQSLLKALAMMVKWSQLTVVPALGEDALPRGFEKALALLEEGTQRR